MLTVNFGINSSSRIDNEADDSSDEKNMFGTFPDVAAVVGITAL